MRFRFEPTAIIESVRALILLAVVMNWAHLTDAQQTSIVLAVSAVLAAINRSLVTSNAKINEAVDLL
jgi:hypothetical protein